MPIELPTPIAQPAVALVAKEISSFSVDLERMRAEVRFTYVDEKGVRHHGRDEDVTLELVDGEGMPRFTAEEYGSIKGVLYRLSAEDGFIP